MGLGYAEKRPFVKAATWAKGSTLCMDIQKMKIEESVSEEPIGLGVGGAGGSSRGTLSQGLRG